MSHFSALHAMLLDGWAWNAFRKVPPHTNCADQTERILSPDSLNMRMSFTDKTFTFDREYFRVISKVYPIARSTGK